MFILPYNYMMYTCLQQTCSIANVTKEPDMSSIFGPALNELRHSVRTALVGSPISALTPLFGPEPVPPAVPVPKQSNLPGPPPGVFQKAQAPAQQPAVKATPIARSSSLSDRKARWGVGVPKAQSAVAYAAQPLSKPPNMPSFGRPDAPDRGHGARTPTTKPKGCML